MEFVVVEILTMIVLLGPTFFENDVESFAPGKPLIHPIGTRFFLVLGTDRDAITLTNVSDEEESSVRSKMLQVTVIPASK